MINPLIRNSRYGFVAVLLSVLAACGGGGSSTPSTTVNTTISGSAVKGPVSGATVVVKSVSTGAALGNTTTSPAGTYSLSISFSGDVVVEISGGSYLDEATGRSTTLATPMRVVLAANGGNVTGMVTPLTTLAYTYSSNGGNAPSAANFAATAATMASQFGLAGVNIATTQPIVTGTTNNYGRVISAFSTYLNNNSSTTSLSTLINQQMGSTTYASFNSAFASAYTQANGQPITISFNGNNSSVSSSSTESVTSTVGEGTSSTGSVTSTTSSGTSSTGSVTSTTGSTSTGSPSASQPLAQYQGTFLGSCVPVLSGSGSTVGSTIESAAFSQPSSNGNVSSTSITRFYTSANCTGTAVATITELPLSVVHAGTKTVGSQTVNKIIVTIPAGTPTFTGSAVSLSSCGLGGRVAVVVTLGTGLNTVQECSQISTVTQISKQILTLLSANNTYDYGDLSDVNNLDAEGFPNLLEDISTSRFTRQ